MERQDIPRIVAIGTAYFLAVRLSYLFPDSSEVMAVIWPASGISLAALLLAPKRKWPLLLAVIGAVDLLGKVSLGKSVPVSAGYMLANVLEPLLGAWFISRWSASPVRFTRTAELMALLGAAVAINGFTTLIGAGTAVLAYGAPLLSAYADWWVADGMGILLITPLIVFGAAAGPELRRVARWPMIAELVSFAALFCILLWQVFGPSVDKAFPGLGPYMLVLLFGWAALRFGRFITATALLLLTVVAVGFSGRSVGSHILSGADWKHHLMFLQIYVAVITLTALLLSISVFERTEAERRSRESEERLRYIVDSNIVGVAIASPSGGVIQANDYYLRLIGYTREEFEQGMVDWRAITPPEWLPADERAIREMRDRGTCTPYEKEYVRRDGKRVSVFLSDAMLPGPEEEMVAFVLDTTERKRAEIDLRENHELLLQYVRHSPIYTYIKEVNPTESRVLYASENFRQMIGISGGDIAGKTMTELFPADFAAKITADDWAVVSSGEVLKLEEELNGRNYTSIKFPVVRGGKTLLAGYTIDNTDREKAEEAKLNLERQVQQAQKLESLGVLAGGIAHDFNNLLMVVLGHAELALGTISPMSPARNSLAEISTAARRAADLSQQMLAYAGKGSFTLERVGLRELVEEMAHLLQAAISKKAILNLHLERGLPLIEADPTQIRQIVMNMIINASEAIGDRSGVISVSVGATRCDDGFLRGTQQFENLAPGLYVHLEVSDTGCGMDAETRSRIFEPFFSTKFTGRGLGLAAVLGIVRAHRGAIKVYSEPGKGTTFKILFPALEEAEEDADLPDTTALSGWRGKGTILLVDDEESLLALGGRMLELLGFTVLTATDGLQALARYRERGKEIDLVLLDLTMPHMDGVEAFGELRRLDPEVRVVLASGYSREDVASRFAGKGIDGVLQKPYTLLKLREALAGLLPERQDGEG